PESAGLARRRLAGAAPARFRAVQRVFSCPLDREGEGIIASMNALNIAEYTQTLGLQAKQASALMARSGAATRNGTLLALARLLRANLQPLQAENAKDLERATGGGLPAPMVDRLKLTPKIIETVAQGCEQLAAMPDIIGEIVGMRQQPSGIR